MEFIRGIFTNLNIDSCLGIGLMIYALTHILKHNKFKFGNKVMWIVVVVLIQIIGPILYLTMGKDNE